MGMEVHLAMYTPESRKLLMHRHHIFTKQTQHVHRAKWVDCFVLLTRGEEDQKRGLQLPCENSPLLLCVRCFVLLTRYWGNRGPGVIT